MFLKRIISSLLLTSVVILSLFILPQWFFVSLMIVFCVLATHEFFELIKKKGIPALNTLGLFIAAAIPFAIFNEFELTRGFELFFVVLVIIILFIMQFTRKDNTQAIVAMSITLFGAFYVSWLFTFLLRIFLLPGGGIFTFFLLLVIKMGDVAAYIGGTKFGKHSLIKRISPKKTVEGSIFALSSTIIFAGLSKIYLQQVSVLHLVILGMFLGILGQLGDLSESLIKRDCQSKDSGNLIPGFGGVLDLVDSILFAAPAFYFYLIHGSIMQ